MSQVIAITGRKYAGKDTIAAVYMKHFGFHRVSFAGPLKNMLRAYLKIRGCNDDYVERCLEGDLKQTPIPELNGREPRYAMQTLGTEWGRNMMSDSIWVDAWKAAVAATSLVVTADLRFPNEEQAAREAGATIIKVVRPSMHSNDVHVSEAHIGAIRADLTLINDYESAEEFQKDVFEQLSLLRKVS